MMEELLDLVNKNDEVIGSVYRSAAHSNPHFTHREIAVAIYNDNGEVALQQRSFSKKFSPGKWKVSSEGHVAAGQDPYEACRREVAEELGIEIKPSFFRKVFNLREGKESRIIWQFYAKVAGRPELIIQEAEVEDAMWIPVAELENFAQDNYYQTDSRSHQLIVDTYNFLFDPKQYLANLEVNPKNQNLDLRVTV